MLSRIFRHADSIFNSMPARARPLSSASPPLRSSTSFVACDPVFDLSPLCPPVRECVRPACDEAVVLPWSVRASRTLADAECHAGDWWCACATTRAGSATCRRRPGATLNAGEIVPAPQLAQRNPEAVRDRHQRIAPARCIQQCPCDGAADGATGTTSASTPSSFAVSPS